MNTWWLVCKKELREIWIGGRALNLIIAFTVLMSIYSFMTIKGSVDNFVPPKEMVYEALKLVIAVGVFMGLIIGADNLSGERERATLEALLLTPASRRQIVVGKFVAALSPWPVALVIGIPYMRVMAHGDEVLVPALLWGGLLGTILVLGFTALGMIVSFWSGNNKTSLFVSLVLYVLFLIPTQLSGHAQGGFMGRLFQGLNPMGAPRVFLAKILVNNRTIEQEANYLISPVVFTVLVLAALLWYAGPGLRLEAGRAGRRRVVLAWLIGLVALAAPRAHATIVQDSQVALQSSASPLSISIDVAAKTVQAGASLEYSTVLTNHAATASTPLIVAMNIINLNAQGDVVDPEDWSPERTQYREGLGAGESATLSWRINAILDGDFMIYMVAIPAPAGEGSTSRPVASSGIHLTVTPNTQLNPGGVLPYAVGGPVVLALVIFFVYRQRRRQVDAGEAVE
jgi:ABC-2 type transport system permease protein